MCWMRDVATQLDFDDDKRTEPPKPGFDMIEQTSGKGLGTRQTKVK